MSRSAWVCIGVGLCLAGSWAIIFPLLQNRNPFDFRRLVPIRELLTELVSGDRERELRAINELGRYGAAARPYLPDIHQTFMQKETLIYWYDEIRFKNLAFSLSKIVGSTKEGDDMIRDWREEWLRRYPELEKQHWSDLHP